MSLHVVSGRSDPSPRRKGIFAGLTGRDLADAVQGPQWLCRELGVAPGRPTLLAGYGGVGKTLLAQELALSVAAGREEVWGGVRLDRGGRVLHLDYELGPYLPTTRYQRLARGKGIDLAELGERLELVPFAHQLSEDDNGRALIEACRGATLLVVDNFRSAFPSLDENDSSARKPLDGLARISTETGCVMVVLVHEHKASRETASRSKGQRIRGSSALYDAAGCVLSVSSEDGLITIEHTKATMGEARAAAYVRLLDGGLTDTDGVSETLEVQGVSESTERREERREKKQEDIAMGRARRELLRVLSAATTELSGAQAAKLARGNLAIKYRALETLARDGLARVVLGTRNSRLYSITQAGREELKCDLF